MIPNADQKILVAELHKLMSPEIDSVNSRNLIALGYYDAIRLNAMQSVEDLANSTGLAGVGVEKTILIPATRARSLDVDAIYAGGITFICVDEDNNTDLFAMAGKIEDFLSRGKLPAKAYVTLGASAIAIITWCEDAGSFVADFSGYLHNMQQLALDYAQESDSIPYTFTIPIMRPDMFYQKILAAGSLLLKSVFITFSTLSDQIDKIDGFLDKVAGQLGFGPGLYEKGILPGTDDYYAYLGGVELSRFVKLFCSGGLLSSMPLDNNTGRDWYGNYCNSTMSTVGFDSDHFTPPTHGKRPYHDKEEDPITARNPILNRHLKAFNELANAKITEWVYLQYKDIVKLFANLSEENREEPETLDKDLNDTDFVRLHHQMLEALLNTSTYLTDSPGYRTTETNFAPRLLVYYQRIINDLVSEWDSMSINSVNRKHLFFLYTQDNVSVKARTFFPKLPPDHRVVGIGVPVFDTYYVGNLFAMMLHEVGHYVGVRHRNEERIEVFIELVIATFYRRMIFIIQESNHKDVSLDNILAMIKNGWDETLIHLVLSVYEGYESEKDFMVYYYSMIRDKIESAMKLENPNPSEKAKRRMNALKNNYFIEMSEILRKIYRIVLMEYKGDLYPPVVEHFRRCIAQYPGRENDYRDMKNDLLDKLKYTQIKIYDELCNANTKDFIQESEDILSEVAADVFMVRVSGMNIRHYLCHVFERFILVGNEYDHIVRDFKGNISQIVRVLSICYVLCHSIVPFDVDDHDSDRERKLLQDCFGFSDGKVLIEKYERSSIQSFCKCIKEGHDESKYIESYKAFINTVLSLYEDIYVNVPKQKWIRELSELFLPCRTVGKYALSIYRDERYEYFGNKKELEQSVKSLREIYNMACDGKTSIIQVYKKIMTPRHTNEEEGCISSEIS